VNPDELKYKSIVYEDGWLYLVLGWDEIDVNVSRFP
jgi:hypothetical protein